MSLVSAERWRFWLGDMPMPEDCTNEEMWAAYDAVYAMESREYASEQIKWYESLWRKNKPKYDEALKHKDSGDEKLTEKLIVLSQTMKLIKDGIQYWREELIS